MDQPGMLAARPMPALEPHTEPFWRGVRERRLLLQKCTTCARIQFPPEPSCTHCGAAGVEWVEASGRATLYSWTICHPPLLPYFAERAPWPVAAVQLEEGVRMATELVDIAPEAYAMDMPLIADFRDVGDEHTFVVFRPA